MTEIREIASAAGVDWRTLLKITPKMAPAVADALCTRLGERTSEQQGILTAAQQISVPDDATERKLRRMRGVNTVREGTRVNGQTLNDVGQPRGQKRGR